MNRRVKRKGVPFPRSPCTDVHTHACEWSKAAARLPYIYNIHGAGLVIETGGGRKRGSRRLAPLPTHFLYGRGGWLFCQSIVIQLTTLNFVTHAPIMPQMEVLNQPWCQPLFAMDGIYGILFACAHKTVMNHEVVFLSRVFNS